MKKTAKRLVLSRETLSNLESSLEQVAGGITRFCTFSGYNTCQTCEATCGTNLC
jgi:hypothetical protein